MGRTKQPRLWVLLADGAHARVVVSAAVRPQFRTEIALDSVAAHQRSAALGADRPGRVFESANAARHAIVPRRLPQESAEERFLAVVAERLEAELQRGSFGRLVLVAPDRVLFRLRQQLAAVVLSRVAAVIDKDLVNVADADLGRHLAPWWAAPADVAA